MPDTSCRFVIFFANRVKSVNMATMQPTPACLLPEEAITDLLNGLETVTGAGNPDRSICTE